jgi:hypothetical protein
VTIDPFTEEVLSFAQAARRLPRMRGGRPVSPATLWRWATSGLRGVRLETTHIGGTRCTSLEALARFFAGLAKDNAEAASAPRPTQLAAEAELGSIGIL